MIKVRVDGNSYYYEPETLYMYETKVLGNRFYYNPLNFCDVRIKKFIKPEEKSLLRRILLKIKSIFK